MAVPIANNISLNIGSGCGLINAVTIKRYAGFLRKGNNAMNASIRKMCLSAVSLCLVLLCSFQTGAQANLVANGDFSDGTNDWALQYGPAGGVAFVPGSPAGFAEIFAYFGADGASLS